MDPFSNGLKLREIVGKELKLQKLMDNNKKWKLLIFIFCWDKIYWNIYVWEKQKFF
jgi:hypothetical protein